MSAGLYCVELRTTRWDQMVQWYRNTLGLRVLVRVVEDGYALLEAGQARLAIIARKVSAEPSLRWSLAFEVDSLELAAQRLRENGATVSELNPSLEGFRDLLTYDPDGNRIRVFCWPEHR